MNIDDAYNICYPFVRKPDPPENPLATPEYWLDDELEELVREFVWDTKGLEAIRMMLHEDEAEGAKKLVAWLREAAAKYARHFEGILP